MLTLRDAEMQLDALIDAGDESGWAQVAEVLAEVERGALWKPDHHSFSAWVRAYAQRKGCSESLLWKYCKAGRAYERARAAVPGLPPMREASMSAATVANAEKIHGDDAAAVGRLLAKVERGEVKPKDVSEMWKAARKVCGARKSRHAAKPAVGGEGDAELTRALTAALARQAAAWIWGAETAAEAEERKRREAPRQFLARDAVCVRTLVEFPVRVESAERARRVDLAAVCVENQTTADWMDVVLRGVEVKVSEADLGRDAKMGDYGLFMDYMYVACPADLVRQAADAVPADWGVLAYDRDADAVEVVREPERLDAPRREDALMTACVKLAQREIK